MKNHWIGLLDCNNFFVSCERLFRPELRDKPVVVLSSNDGCVVARSQEVKDMGVLMGVPYFKIKDTLKNKDVTVFSSHLTLYRDISRRVFSVMRSEMDVVEQYSIDEAFFTVKFGSEDVLDRLKNVVEKQVGIPVSIGLAKTKTIAKYANLLAKKQSGIMHLNHDKWDSIRHTVPLSAIWGVGGKSEIKYNKYGLNTVEDLVSLDKDRVSTLFGINGIRLQEELSGNAVYTFSAKSEPQKSILSSRSFKDTSESFSVLADAVAYHVRHTAKDLRSMQMETSSIRVSIQPSRYGDFLLRGGSKEAVLTQSSSDSLNLLKVANGLLCELFEEGVPYKKVGVTLSSLSPANHGQNTLFAKDKNSNNSKLMGVIDSLNIKADREVVLIGSHLESKKWKTRVDSKSQAYTTNWKEVLEVKA
jgi:DNA polymerase V